MSDRFAAHVGAGVIAIVVCAVCGLFWPAVICTFLVIWTYEITACGTWAAYPSPDRKGTRQRRRR